MLAPKARPLCLGERMNKTENTFGAESTKESKSILESFWEKEEMHLGVPTMKALEKYIPYLRR
jgi:hypothetical protein